MREERRRQSPPAVVRLSRSVENVLVTKTFEVPDFVKVNVFLFVQASGKMAGNDSIECITLDSDEESRAGSGGPAGRLVGAAAPRAELMQRCNLCVDPGLLPVEEDRAAHRRNVHLSKLFFCDICGPEEKGARGFEEFADIRRHVARENGIEETDTVS